MIESLADIEALSIRCRSDQSRAYIAESIQCYRAGAYRASIVSTWIAVVFDLVDKVRELSLTGDASAQALETRYETYIEQIEQGIRRVSKARWSLNATSLISVERTYSFSILNSLLI